MTSIAASVAAATRRIPTAFAMLVVCAAIAALASARPSQAHDLNGIWGSEPSNGAALVETSERPATGVRQQGSIQQIVLRAVINGRSCEFVGANLSGAKVTARFSLDDMRGADLSHLNNIGGHAQSIDGIDPHRFLTRQSLRRRQFRRCGIGLCEFRLRQTSARQFFRSGSVERGFRRCRSDGGQSDRRQNGRRENLPVRLSTASKGFRRDSAAASSARSCEAHPN